MIKTLAAAAVLSLGLAGYADGPRHSGRCSRSDGRRRCTIITIIIITITITTTCTTRLRWLLRLRLPRNNQTFSADLLVRAKPSALQTRSCLESFFLSVWRRAANSARL